MLKTKGYYYQQNHYSCSIKNRAGGNRAAGTNAKSSFIKRPWITKVENILKGNLDLIPSPSASVKIQIMSRKRCKGAKAKHCWAMSTNF